ncbi:MAG TPA: methyltransferase domain-containing protein [Polyangiales bacterium]|nr:methyltransferase domain-containing protein [Polyangiales bacterium]
MTELDSVRDELTSDALTDRVRVLQRKRGHRFSYDDVVTAWVAARAAPGARSHLDLGCGIGSVLLMLADRLPLERSVGIEAQAESYALLSRNVAASGFSERIELHWGDLRELRVGTFELVTGTPPYKPPGTATPSPDAQRAHARVELRGGVEQYLAAAAVALAPQGVCVVCMETPGLRRVQLGAAAAGLSIAAQLDVIPRAGRQALFSVFTLQLTAAGPCSYEQLVLRDAEGERTDQARALRSFFGLPSLGS